MMVERLSRRAWLSGSTFIAAMAALVACGQAVQGTATAATATVGAAAAIPAAATASTASVLTPTSPATVATIQTASATSTVATVTGATTSIAGAGIAAPVQAGATTAAPASGVKLTLDAQGNQASYQVQEQLAGHNLPSDAIGRTSAVSGAILIDANGKLVPDQSRIEIDLRTLRSDQSMRDGYIQRNPLNTAQYPTATFVPTTVSGMPWPLPVSGKATFSLTGAMTVHGATKTVTWPVAATFTPDKVTGSASMPFTFSEFGMQPPHTAIALTVQDNGTLTLQFTATRSGG